MFPKHYYFFIPFFPMKKFTSLFIAIIILMVNASFLTSNKSITASAEGETSAETSKQPFDDVATSHPNQEAVAYLKTEGVVQGYDDGTFLPDYTINRAEFLKIVIAATVKESKGEKCFKDVKNEWYAKYICTAKEKGIVEGYSDGFFRPGQNINFAEGSKMIVKAFGLKESGAQNKQKQMEKNDIWFKKFVETLQGEKAIPVSIDYAEKKLTRGEMSEITWRLKADIETKPTKTFGSLTAELPTIASCEELKEKISLANYMNNRFRLPREAMMDTMEEGEEGAAAEGIKDLPAIALSTEKKADDDYSETNVQEQGVDEADVIKNDGKYIYLIKGRTIRIVKAVPPDAMKELTKIRIAEENFYPQEIYTTDNDLVAIGQSFNDGAKTDVYVFDITDRENIVQKRKISFDGNYISSRRIGNKVYFVMNDYPEYHILEKTKEGEDLVPKYLDSKIGIEKPVAGCTAIKFFPRYGQPNFLIIASVPLDNIDGIIHKQLYMGAGETIYSSLKNMYVATNRYEHNEQVRYDIWIPPITNTSTLLYRFQFNEGKIEYRGSGTVPGTILNQFAMDEEGGTFRIATTKGDFWAEETNGKPTNQLYILDAENLSTILGKIENIGANEKIKSVRFLGNKAYLVTFRNTDPFFVIDLTNPAAPKILGELKIPGYSDYLHPYDENHVLGFGKEAVAMNEKFAYYQGMKVALFDVTDVANPKLQFQEIIGDRGTNSELLYNHKALLFSREKNLIAFPVEVAEVKNKDLEKPDPGAYGEIIFRGAYVYSLDLEKGFQLKGKITHLGNNGAEATSEEEKAELMPQMYGPDTALIKRIIYMGNSLYSISMAKIQAHDLSDMKEQGEVVLEKDENSYGATPVMME